MYETKLNSTLASLFSVLCCKVPNFTRSTTNTADKTPASNPTATSTGSSNESQDLSTAYTARPFGAIQSINATCPSTLLISSQLEGNVSHISGRNTYSCLDNTNTMDESDLMTFTAYTLEQCVDACSQYSAMGSKNETCKAVVINSQFRERYEMENGADCWLKGTVNSASARKTGYTAAILREQ